MSEQPYSVTLKTIALLLLVTFYTVGYLGINRINNYRDPSNHSSVPDHRQYAGFLGYVHSIFQYVPSVFYNFSDIPCTDVFTAGVDHGRGMPG
jgi:hypothetical protein